MDHGLAARHVAARQLERADLDAERALDPHRGPHAVAVGRGAAQVDVHDVARVADVAQDGDAGVEVRVDDVEVPVAAQVAERRAEAHRLLVEAPRRAHVLEPQAAHVAKAEVPLGLRRALVHDAHALRGGLGALHPHDGVGARVPGEAVRHEEVQAAVVVQVLEPHRPRPVRRGHAGEEGSLLDPPGPRVEEESVSVVLGLGARLLLGAAPRVGERVLVPHVRARGHVGDQKVDVPVVLHVARVGPHG